MYVIEKLTEPKKYCQIIPYVCALPEIVLICCRYSSLKE